MATQTQQQDDKGGFDVFGLVDGIIGAASSCEGNCWTSYPPFSGDKNLRTQCLLACKQAGAPVTHNTGGGGISTSGLLTAAALGLGLFVVLDKPKKGRKR